MLSRTESQNAVGSEQKFDSRYANRTLLLFAAFAIFVMYVESMLTPSLLSIQQDFGVTSAQVSLVLSAYLVSGAALSPIVGKLGDIYGKKKIFTIVLFVYAAAVTTSGFAPNFTFLVASRTIQGIGLTMFPLTFSLAREEFPRELIPRTQGILSGMFGAGFAVGLPVGSYISENFGWRTTYHTALPLAILFAVLITALVHESKFRKPQAKVDYVGAGALGLSIGLIVLALTQGSNWGWTSTSTLGMMLAGILILPPLAVYERRKSEPVLDLKMMRVRNVSTSNIVMLLTGLALFLAYQIIVFELELSSPVGYGFSIFATGLALVPFAIIMLLFSPGSALLSTRIGAKKVAGIGSVIAAISFVLATTATTSTQLIEYVTLSAVGFALIMTAVQNLLVLTVDPREMGLATSMNTVFRLLGSALGAPIAGSLMTTFTTTLAVGVVAGRPIFATVPSSTAFNYAFDIGAALFVIGTVFVLLSREVLSRLPMQTKAPVSEPNEPSPWRSPAVRALFAVETGVVGFMSFWIAEEYLNNAYLQSYMGQLAGAYGVSIMAAVGLVLVFSIAAVFRLRHGRRLEHPLLVS
jgi:MFS family permease